MKREQLEDVADGIEGETFVSDGDVSDTESVNECIDEVVEAFGGLDIVVNNARVVTGDTLSSTPNDEINQVIDVNLNGVIRMARRTLPELTKSERTLINVGSIAGERGVQGLSVYSAAKGGVTSLTQQLAVEYGDEGVRVNAIIPGTIKTTVNREKRQTDPEWTEQRREKVPLGRLGVPEDIADPAVFLASDKSRYVTGHALAVDGGVLAST